MLPKTKHTMKLYFWNFLALGLLLVSWLIVWVGHWLMPKSWDAVPFHLGLLVYVAALAVLAWGIIRVVWQAIQGMLHWSRSLLVIGITLVQSFITLFFFIFLLAEGFKKEG
jgi:hypothetical protein